MFSPDRSSAEKGLAMGRGQLHIRGQLKAILWLMSQTNILKMFLASST
jgi:hypothetical protein